MEPFVDLTVPDLEMIGTRAGRLLDEYSSLVYPPGYDPDKPVNKRKVCCYCCYCVIIFVVAVVPVVVLSGVVCFSPSHSVAIVCGE